MPALAPVQRGPHDRNPIGQEPVRFHRLRTFGGDAVSVDPQGQTPDRFREEPRVFVRRSGETPGTMELDTGAKVQAPGTIRRLWMQAVHPVPAPPPVQVAAAPLQITRALRYKASTNYLPAGSRNSRFTGMHTMIPNLARQPRPTRSAGTRQGRPTVRNRMESFGSRVTPLNPRVAAAQGSS